jgi:FixJ family two-component response regulator
MHSRKKDTEVDTALSVKPIPPADKFAKACADPIPMTDTRGGASICVLDDDRSMLKAVERLLKSEKFKVEKFSEPAAFLASVGKTPCRVVILDVWMPEMNGLDVQALLRKSAPGTRIIFISGRDDPSVRQAALEAGAFAYLAKPFEGKQFLQCVHEAVAA